MEKPPTPTIRPVRSKRQDYRLFRTIPTRWADNDIYGHVNNVVYYQWFDTAVNAWLIDVGALVIGKSPIIGLVVETRCSYFESISFPETVDIGIAVERLGRSSVTYAVGVFRHLQLAGAQPLEQALALAEGRFTHVYVEQASQTPCPIPGGIRAHMELISR